MSDALIKQTINIGEHRIDYICGPGAIEGYGFPGNDPVFISKVIDELFPEKIERIERTRRIVMDDGESIKSLGKYEEVCEILMKKNIGRDNILSYVGGGTLGDLIGFVASTFKRGTGLIAYPTTFLSQIDSSIGGKNGINLNNAKNMLGSFRNPDTIIADTEFIMGNSSLILDGLPEAIKHGFSLDYEIINILEKTDPEELISGAKLPEFIIRNALAKAEICNLDPEETGTYRFKLNFGHTVAHGLEAATENKISHGMAVLYGMQVEMLMAEIMGKIDSTLREKLNNIMKKYEMNLPGIGETTLDDAWKYIENDKKIRNKMLQLPMITGNGKSEIISIEISKLKDIYMKTVENMFH